MDFCNYLLGRISKILLFAVVMAMFAIPASADTIYDNGFGNGQDAEAINKGNAVADSFTVSGTFNLISVEFWVDVIPDGDETPTSVEWAIVPVSTDPFSLSPLDYKQVSLTSNGFTNMQGCDDSGCWNWNIYDMYFDLPPDYSLVTGTYYLVLQNANSHDGNTLYWDMSYGASAAYQNSLGSSIDSESFIINGTDPVPELGTLPLLGIGLLFLVPLGLRRRVKSVSFAA